MKINIAQLKKEIGSTQTFSFQIPVAELGLEKQEEIWTGDVSAEGFVKNKGTIYEVAGTIKATMNDLCSRCLEPVVIVLNIPFCEEYREVDFKELSEVSESEVTYFDGDDIEITDLVRENILLAKPLKPVCGEECRGLCPECGANMNISTCNCNLLKTDPRLAVLQKLLPKD